LQKQNKPKRPQQNNREEQAHEQESCSKNGSTDAARGAAAVVSYRRNFGECRKLEDSRYTSQAKSF
jgi:hypothetical protein